MPDDVFLMVRVTPRANRDEIGAFEDGILRVRLRAPPVEGRANEALRRLVAEKLEVAVSQVEIVAGDTSRTKRIRVAGLTREEVTRRLLV